MATQMFLQIMGLKGGSTNPRHLGEIEISGFTLGGSQKTMAVAQGLSNYTEMSSPHDITVNRFSDISSKRLQSAVFMRENFPKGVLMSEVITADGIVQQTIRIEIENFLFTSYSVGGGTQGRGASGAEETLTLNCTRIQISYSG